MLQSNGAYTVNGAGIADSSTYTTIVATTTDSNVLLTTNSITFTTTKGVFSNDSTSYTVHVALIDTGLDKTANALPIARAYLKDNSAEQAYVTATLSGIVSYANNATINFATAYPSALSVIVGTSSLPDTVTSYSSITAKLICNTGYASVGQVVYFSAFPDSAGVFLNNTIATGPGDSVTTQYWVTNPNVHGQYVSITGVVYMPSSSGGLVAVASGVNKIYIW